MMSIAVVIFREVLEIALIIGVLLAATRGLKKRTPWVWLGALAGVVGACIVAFFADTISSLAEGMGQEVMNAIILLIAAVLIAWTVVWMARYGRELSQRFRDVGQAVRTGEKPIYTLAVVVALAVLREGAEIVMFIYSAVVTGTKVYQLAIGSLMGIAAGTALGVAIYYGLMKVPLRKIFAVTSGLLTLLVAGMVAQAFGFLSAAGKVPEIIPVVWDTSWLMSEEGLVGRMLHVLIGYTARPSGIQLLMYCLTGAGLGMALKCYGQESIKKLKKVLMVVALVHCVLGVAQPAYAAKKVYSPIVEKGEWELEMQGSYKVDHRKDENAAVQYKAALGYGIMERWFTEIYLELEREPAPDEEAHLKATHMEWENRFQLTEQGQYWADVGLYFAYETALSEGPSELEAKLLLEKSLGRFTHTANIIFKKEIGGGYLEQAEGGFAWSSRYRWSEHVQPGIEYYADLGEFKARASFDEQAHQIGPAFYGKLTKNIKYDVGYLFGVSRAVADGELKWNVEYEF